MKKSDRKTENSLRKALMAVCDQALDRVKGFLWLTHFVDHSDVPGSLVIVCVFDDQVDLLNVTGGDKLDHDGRDFLCSLIEKEFSAENLMIRKLHQHVRFDSESNYLQRIKAGRSYGKSL